MIRKGRFAWKLRTHFHAINVLFVFYGEMIQFFHRKPVEFRGITEKRKEGGVLLLEKKEEFYEKFI